LRKRATGSASNIIVEEVESDDPQIGLVEVHK